MTNFFDFSPIKRSFAAARSIPVVLPQEPNKDKVAAALGLFLCFQKMGKEVCVLCSDEMTVELSWLVGVDKIKQKMDGKNLLISFDYVKDSIEKVSYNIEGGKFNLVVQPKDGFSPLATDKIDYSYSGSQADLIFTIGSSSLTSLGRIYQENKALFDEDKIVNLDYDANNSRFGKYHLIDTRASSCSELAISLLSKLGLPVDADIASNLFYGLEISTQNFSLPDIGPEAFEAAAFCLRAGARKREQKNITGGVRKKADRGPVPVRASSSWSPDLIEKSRPKDFDEKAEEKPAPDWFEPKIYQGNTRI